MLAAAELPAVLLLATSSSGEILLVAAFAGGVLCDGSAGKLLTMCQFLADMGKNMAGRAAPVTGEGTYTCRWEFCFFVE